MRQILATLILLGLAACQSPEPPPTPQAPSTTTKPDTPPEAKTPAPSKPTGLEVIATLGDLQITLNDYDRALKRYALFSPNPQARALPPSQIQSPYFQHTTTLNLMHIAISRKEAQRRGLKANKDEQEHSLSQEKSLAYLAPLSSTAREAKLGEYGLDNTDLTAILSDRILSDKLTQLLVDELTVEDAWKAWRAQRARTEIAFLEVSNTPSSNNISDYVATHGAEIEAHHKANPDKYKAPATRRVRLLLKKLSKQASPDQLHKAKKELTALRTRVLAGEDFATLAKDHSQHHSAAQGGDLGMVVRPQRPEAFRIKVGDISEPIPVREGLALLKVEKEVPTRKQALTPALRREIAAKLMRHQAIDKDAQNLADQLQQAWTPAFASRGEPSPEMQALMKKHHLRMGKSLPFPNDAPDNGFIPGIGEAPELMKIIRGLSASKPVAQTIPLINGKLYIVALKKRGVARRAQFEAEKDSFIPSWKKKQKQNILQRAVDATVKRKGIKMNLAPVDARYGTIKTKQ